MIAYALRRFVVLGAVVVLSIAATFVILGSSYGSIYGHVTVWHQLGRLPAHLVRVFGHLDLGYDKFYRQPISHSLLQGLPVDAALMLGGLVVGVAIGLGIGLLTGPRARSAVDGVLMLGSAAVLSIPVYLIGNVVIDEFSNTTGRHRLAFISGPGDYRAITHDPIGWLHGMWVPWLIVGAPLAAVTFRMTRAVMREGLDADFVRTARAKGLSERLVMRRHVFRAALPAILGTASVTVPTVVVNAILVESAMEIPGLLRRFDISPQTGDKFTSPPFPLVESLVLETTVLIVAGILICEVLHAWLDPQIRR